MRSQPFRGILGAALLLATGGFDLGRIQAEARREEELAKRRTIATILAGDGPHTVMDCEAMLLIVGDDHRLAGEALQLAQTQGIALVEAAKQVAALPPDADDAPLRRTTRRGTLDYPKAGTVGYLEVSGRRGPGRQLQDERERVGEPLRILAAYTGLSAVELAEIERGVAVPTPEQWAALQVALPELGAMEAPPTEAERSPTIRVERDLVLNTPLRQAPPGSQLARLRAETARLEAALHPAGRCTCGAGGTRNCEWCVMDQRREKREARHERRTERDRDEPRRELVLASVIESERKSKRRKARARVKARRGW